MKIDRAGEKKDLIVINVNFINSYQGQVNMKVEIRIVQHQKKFKRKCNPFFYRILCNYAYDIS